MWLCVHHLFFIVLSPSCQGSVEFSSGNSVGQHQAAVHHRQTLLKLQFHLQPVIFRHGELGRAQTPGRRERQKGRKQNTTTGLHFFRFTLFLSLLWHSKVKQPVFKSPDIRWPMSLYSITHLKKALQRSLSSFCSWSSLSIASCKASLVQLSVCKAALPSWCSLSWPCRRELAPDPGADSGSTGSRECCAPGGTNDSTAWVAEGWMTLSSANAPWITRMVTWRTINMGSKSNQVKINAIFVCGFLYVFPSEFVMNVSDVYCHSGTLRMSAVASSSRLLISSASSILWAVSMSCQQFRFWATSILPSIPLNRPDRSLCLCLWRLSCRRLEAGMNNYGILRNKMGNRFLVWIHNVN